jgi:hypothetical protein
MANRIWTFRDRSCEPAYLRLGIDLLNGVYGMKASVVSSFGASPSFPDLREPEAGEIEL